MTAAAPSATPIRKSVLIGSLMNQRRQYRLALLREAVNRLTKINAARATTRSAARCFEGSSRAESYSGTFLGLPEIFRQELLEGNADVFLEPLLLGERLLHEVAQLRFPIRGQ